uniref:EF-hand domain-containing protein n=1 Tax=Hemiselmis andersenii TaxID=464988 RepID=A0A7S1GW80_HEMAN|mmetsp:Transcript_20452/g.49557  ORF Transcript_20452/g.49557 Transcript_20452/m.49557 type:complete len:1785 (+) Transcript_20452:401-5755(+)
MADLGANGGNNSVRLEDVNDLPSNGDPGSQRQDDGKTSVNTLSDDHGGQRSQEGSGHHRHSHHRHYDASKYHEKHAQLHHEEEAELRGPRWPDPSKYNARSLGFLTLQNPVRKAIIGAIEWPWWDRTVLFLILLNTVQLGFFYDPFDVAPLRPDSTKRDILENVGMFFNICFMIECACKIFGWGFIVGPHTYLKDAWNYLDFFIVIIGVLDFLPADEEGGGGSNLSSLRSLRVMRPLRAVTKFPELRFLIVLLLQCIPMLSNVLGLCSFIFLVFGILGVQLFQGILRGQCYSYEDGSVHDPAPCSLATEGGGLAKCPLGYECLLLGENPEQGIVHFDSIGGAIMSIFQVMTMEGWNDMMYAIQDTYHPLMCLYFVLLIFLGPIFAVQLFLVVISTKFAETKESLKALEASKVSAEAANRTFDGGDYDMESSHRGANTDRSGLAGAASGPAAPIQHKDSTLPDFEDSGTMEESNEPTADRVGASSPESGEGDGSAGGVVSVKKQRRSKKKRSFFGRILYRVQVLAKSEGMGNAILLAICLNTLTMAINHDCSVGLDCTLDQAECEGCPAAEPYCKDFKASLEFLNLIFAFIFIVEAAIKIVGLGPWEYFTNKANLFDMIIVIVSGVEIPSVWETFKCLQAKEAFLTVCGQADCPDGPHYLPVSNKYFPYCLDYTSCESGGGAVMVLRTFRLVRIVKLLRAFPDVQKQVKIVVGILGSVAALIGLIFIFLLIFCILGMNIFGGKLVAEWDPGLISMGTRVYVDIPGDWLQDRFPGQWHGRPGSIEQVDPFNHSSTPWLVQLEWGAELAAEYPNLGISEEGFLWAAVKEEVGVGAPAIVQVVPRMNFDNIVNAAITTFQVLTVANWNDDMYDTVASTDPGAALYFYTIIVVGNWMLLNLFIAILIQGFAEQKAVQLQENLLKMQEGLLKKLGGLREDDLATKIETLFESIDADGSGVIDKFELKGALEELEINLRPKELQDLVKKYDVDGSGTIDFEEFLSMIKELVKKAEMAVAGEQEDAPGPEGSSPGKIKRRASTIDDSELAKAKAMHDATQAARDNVKHSAATTARNKSLYIFTEKNPVRVLCTYIAGHPYFDKLILSCIFMSSVCLGIERPEIGDNSPEREALKNIDVFLNIMFLSEAVFKVVSLSFSEYIKNGWNRLDFMIVTTSLLDWGLTEGLKDANVDLTVLKIFRIFRIFRALRPLRIIARARGLRILVSTLMSSIKPVMNTVGIALSVFAVFGVLGMQLLSGKMRFCSDPKVFLKENCVGETEDGELRMWMSHPVHFDDIVNAIRALFILATQDDWPDHMWAGVDATGNKSGRWQNRNEVYILYYIFCIMVAGYLIVNIFVGVFVDCYNAAASDMEQPQEPKKISTSKLQDVFDDPESAIRLKICDTVATSAFDLFIAFFISTNVITMAMESFKQSEWQNVFGVFTNFFFAFVFGFECAFKMWAFRPRRYFSSGWNRFDFFIVSVTFLGILIDTSARIAARSAADGGAPSEPPNLMFLRIQRIFRIFRILRAVRIFKTAKGLYAIAVTMMSSMPALVNLLLMLMLLFFMYGVLGVMLFGHLCSAGDETRPGIEAVRCMLHPPETLLDPHANFINMGNALLTLFRIATGDAWGEILYACQVEVVGGFPRKVLDETWKHMVDLLQYDPRTLPPQDPEFLAADDDDAAIKIAMLSIRRWNHTAYGTEDHPAWPLTSDTARDWVALARMALPFCVTDQEMYELENANLAYCGEGIRCVETCGNPYFANFTLVTVPPFSAPSTDSCASLCVCVCTHTRQCV